MTINALAIHRFKTDGDSTSFHARPEAHPVSGLVQELCQELKLAFIGKAGKQFGYFSDDVGACPLPALLRDYLEGRQGFDGLSQRYAEQLQLSLAQSEAQYEGYVLMFHETLADQDHFYIYLVQHEGGLWIDPSMTIAESRLIDVRGLRAGLKVDLGAFQAQATEPYLAQLKARGDKPLADAFELACGFADPVDNAAQTNAFLQLVERYSANLEQERAVTCRKRAADFCIEQDKAGIAVDIANLSEQMDEAAPAAFEQFVQSSAPEAPTQFFADRKQVRQFVRISGRSDSLSLSFSSECLGQTIVYDSGTDTLLVKDIPSALKARLIKYMKDAQE